MTRILQIRRGTAAQHDNFTGLAGEITMDTNAKTLRIHDGETIGGFALARADQVGNGGAGSENDGAGGNNNSASDISAVPPEFWRNLFATYGIAGLQITESATQSIQNLSYIEAAFTGTTAADATNADAKFADCFLVCQTPEAGYAIGDLVYAFGIGNRANPRPNLISTNDELRARLMVAGESFWVSHKDSGTATNITNSKWRLKFFIVSPAKSGTGGIGDGNDGTGNSGTGNNGSFDISSVSAEFWQTLFATYCTGNSTNGESGGGNNSNGGSIPAELPANYDFVIESATGLTGTNYTNGWNRKYKSGWVEQGFNVVTGTAGNITINLPVAMSDANYNSQMTIYGSASTTAIAYEAGAIHSRTATNIVLYRSSSTSKCVSITGMGI
jgi:hypothetical protein